MKQPITGSLVEHGEARFNFQDNETMNYFVKIKSNGSDKIIWGIDLKEKLKNIEPGDNISIQNIGKLPVQVKDKKGNLIDVQRNSFSVEKYTEQEQKSDLKSVTSVTSVSGSEKQADVKTENNISGTAEQQLTVSTSKDEKDLKEFKDSEIPHEIFGVKLSIEDREALASGKSTSLLENMDMEDGSVKDGKVSLVRNKKTDEVELCFNFKKTKIAIPEQIENYKLSQDQQEDLINGKTVLIKYNNQDRYLKIDNDLNIITVKSDKEIGIPQLIGGYKLTDTDKEKLANKEKLTPRVFEGKGRYFIASISITEDGKGLTFSSIKEISPTADINALKAKYNTPDISVAHAAIYAASEAIKTNEIGKETSTAIAPNADIKELDKAVASTKTDMPQTIPQNKEEVVATIAEKHIPETLEKLNSAIENLEAKVKRCHGIMETILKRNTDINNIPPQRYYNVLSRSQDIQNELSKLYQEVIIVKNLAVSSVNDEKNKKTTQPDINTAAVGVAMESVTDSKNPVIEKSAFINAIDNKDYGLLAELSEKQKPAQSDIDYVVNNQKLDKNEKIFALTAMKADVKELDKPKPIAKEQATDNISLKEKGPEKEQKKPGAGKTIEKAAQQAFSDM